MWQGLSCGLVHCPGGNTSEPIWRVLASSDGIYCWTPLKPRRSNRNPNPLANQIWYIDFFSPPTPLIIPHKFPAFLESLMPLKNWCSIHARWFKSSLKHYIRFSGIFSKFKTEFYCILFFERDDWLIFMISGLNEQLQQEVEYTLLTPDCYSWWISKLQSGL